MVRSMRALAALCVLLFAGLSAARPIQLLQLKEEDYNGLDATNAHTYYARWFGLEPGKFPAIEHNYNVDPPEIVPWSVFVRGSSVQVRFRFYNPNFVPSVGVFELSNARFVPRNHPGDAVDLTGQGLVQGVTIPAFEIKDVTVTLEGLPETVCLGTFWGQVNIDVTEGTGYGELWNSPRQFFYFTDAQPTGLMAVPWIEVVDPACDWADELTGPADCARANTFGLFYWQKFAYPIGEPGFPAFWIHPVSKRFRLSDFVNSTAWHDGNCVDVASYFYLSCSSIGVATSQMRHFATMRSDAIGFVTNPICPIGSDPTISQNYLNAGWTMHMNCSVTGLIYDACLALPTDLTGSGYQNPPAGWPLPGYWQTPNGEQFLGLVKRYAYSGMDALQFEVGGSQFIDPSQPPEPVEHRQQHWVLPGIQ